MIKDVSVDHNSNEENNFLKSKIQNLNQELSILSRRLQKPLDYEKEDENIAEISKLKAIITQMKFKEEQNIQEIPRLNQMNQ